MYDRAANVDSARPRTPAPVQKDTESAEAPAAEAPETPR